MRRPPKTIGAGLILALLAALVTGTAHPAGSASATQPPALLMPPAVQAAAQQAAAAGQPYLEMAMQVALPADMGKLEQVVTAAGGQVIAAERTFARVKLPPVAADTVPYSAPVVAVGVNGPVRVGTIPAATADQPVEPGDARQLTAASMDPIGVEAFRSQRGVDGSGVVVAVIDSGVDPGHRSLLRTPDGKPKIIDWQDFTGEGLVRTLQTVPWAAAYTAQPDGRRYQLPARPAASASARFGYWDELTLGGYHLNRDLDRNGQQTDRFGVLLVDSTEAGHYDTVYVDTNNNSSFSDERPLRLYKDSLSVAHMGATPQVTRQINFVVADLAEDGTSVTLGFDGYGHGTQVAGVLGAYEAGGFTGVAPGARIMALKAVGSAGVGDWFAIKRAISYAAQQGAKIINISVGTLAEAAVDDGTAAAFLDMIARDYGVLIVMAADNTGPGLSSGATLGNPSEVMAVGSYYSPQMWKRDYGWVVPHETIWSQSGMGPRADGSYVPSVVAPGGSPTTSPYWIHSTGYTTAIGTSIATPHAAGVAALLMAAGQSAGTNHDYMSVKRALELGARPIPGFQVFEQGHGLVTPAIAFSHLRQINSVPALKGRGADGEGGLLARSYRPGSSAFWLTNLGSELTRVGVYTGEPWVIPGYSSVTLPPGVQRQLPLRFNPPDTPGVHSAFVMVTHPNKYGPSLTIPITYVRPIQLAAPANTYTTSQELEVGRYQRFFFDVKPGTGSLNVTSRVQLKQASQVQGTVQVHVLRPDGKVLHTAKIGADGNGLTALLSTENPLEGSWEVVVTAFPDTSGAHVTAAYTLEVEALPGAMSQVPAKLSVPAGSTTTHPLKVTNTNPRLVGHVEAIGLSQLNPADSWNAEQPWQVHKGTQSPDDFILEQFTSRMRVEISNPMPADVDLNLQLWYRERDSWVPRGQATRQQPNKQLELTNLAPGRYQVIVTPDGAVPPDLQYQYRRLMAVEGYNLRVEDPIRPHDQNESWTAPLTLTAPATPGRYIGQILLRDTETGNVLGWQQLEVSVGEPELLIEPLVPQLLRSKPGTVLLALRDSRTNAFTDATITVNGQRFLSRNGHVAVPVTPTAAVQTLDVTVDKPGYQFVRQQIRLPVSTAWAGHPFGIDPNEELAIWRRKIMSQLAGQQR